MTAFLFRLNFKFQSQRDILCWLIIAFKNVKDTYGDDTATHMVKFINDEDKAQKYFDAFRNEQATN